MMDFEFLEPRGLGKSFCSIEPVSMAILGSAAIGGASSIFSGLMGGSSAAKAANSYKEAALINQQTAFELDRRARADLDPFAAVGRAAAPIYQDVITGKANISDQLNQDPLFKWQSEELQRFNARGLAAQGLTNSGAALELNRRGYSQLLGENSQRYMNNLYNAVALGENAAARQASNTIQTAGNVMQSNMGAAQGIAGAQIQQGVAYGNIGTGIANAAIGGVGTSLNYNLYSQLINRMGGGGTGRSSALYMDFDPSLAGR